MRPFAFFLISATLFAGDLSRRCELTLQRVLTGTSPEYTDDLVLADAIPEHVRRFTLFSGDVSGRYVGALAMASRQSGRQIPALDRVVEKLLKYQKEDGHFGEPLSGEGVKDNDMAMLWGNGRLLIGLLEYYRLNQRPEVLEAARRLGDFLVRVAPIFNSERVRQDYSFGQFVTGYICWTQTIEGLVELYRVTGEARYRRLAEEIAARTERHPAQHSHGFLSSLRGVVELHKEAGNGKYLAQVEREWKGVVESGNLLAQGAIPEAFYPNIRRDEGCSEADWLRLNLALRQLTGKSEYLEQAELNLLNEFAFNQFPSGDFGHYTLTETGVGYESARAWWCCTLHGLRAFPDVFAAVFRSSHGVLFYDLPVDGSGETGGLALRADSNLGRDGTIRLEVVKTEGQIHTLAIRRPSWVHSIDISLDGHQPAVEARDGYLHVSRAWQKGDALTLRYLMRTRVVWHERKPDLVAIFHGPWMLAVDEQLSPRFFDEPHQRNQIILPAAGKDGDPDLERAPASHEHSNQFVAPHAHFKLNYLPGGYPLQAGTAVLRPIAEKTATEGATLWEFWFRVKQ